MTSPAREQSVSSRDRITRKSYWWPGGGVSAHTHRHIQHLCCHRVSLLAADCFFCSSVASLIRRSFRDCSTLIIYGICCGRRNWLAEIKLEPNSKQWFSHGDRFLWIWVQRKRVAQTQRMRLKSPKIVVGAFSGHAANWQMNGRAIDLIFCISSRVSMTLAFF